MEKTAIAAVRTMRGARTAVIGDAAQAGFESADVSLAGRDYLYALAESVTPFRPAAVLLLGGHTSRLAIGPGGPTTADRAPGDQAWTVVECAGGSSHAALADFADWLDALPDAVRLAPWAADHLRELAILLTERHITAPPNAGPEARLLHNVDAPLIDGLPSGPVDELHVYAGTIEPNAAALRAFVARLDPARVVLGLRPQWPADNRDAAQAALAGRATTVRFLGPGELRCGRLAQWRIGDRWFALTGSAQLSEQALLRSIGDGGSCELAVVLPDAQPSTLPDEGWSSAADTAALRPASRDAAVPVVLGASADGAGLHIALAAAQAGPVTVSVSPDASAGSWRVLGTVPAGQASHGFPAEIAAGTAVRATAARPDGTSADSPVVYAYGATQAAQRAAAASAAAVRTAPLSAPAPLAAAAGPAVPPAAVPPIPTPVSAPMPAPAPVAAPIAPLPVPVAEPVRPAASYTASTLTADDENEPSKALLELLVTYPELDEVLDSFRSSGWSVSYDDGLWDLAGSFTNPVPVAARAAEQLGRIVPGSTLLRAQGKNHWVFLAWDAPDLAMLLSNQQIWRSYTFAAPSSPANSFASGDIASAPSLKSPRAKGAPPALARILEGAGLEYAELLNLLYA